MFQHYEIWIGNLLYVSEWLCKWRWKLAPTGFESQHPDTSSIQCPLIQRPRICSHFHERQVLAKSLSSKSSVVEEGDLSISCNFQNSVAYSTIWVAPYRMCFGQRFIWVEKCLSRDFFWEFGDGVINLKILMQYACNGGSSSFHSSLDSETYYFPLKVIISNQIY